MQPKNANQMIDDLNLLDEGASTSTATFLLKENSLLRFQQERMLLLGDNTQTSSNGITQGADSNAQLAPSSEGSLSSVSGAKTCEVAAVELVTVFHRSFRALLASLQKSIDFDQILRWARLVMEKCILSVSFILHFDLSVVVYVCLCLCLVRGQTLPWPVLL